MYGPSVIMLQEIGHIQGVGQYIILMLPSNLHITTALFSQQN